MARALVEKETATRGAPQPGDPEVPERGRRSPEVRDIGVVAAAA
jgi:hypothetical protein